jgi:molybdate transport system regulatory protein
MEMAYSHAWTLVANMNRLNGEELVSRTFGGRQGGRAWLTPAGEAAVAQFWALVAEFNMWLNSRRGEEFCPGLAEPHPVTVPAPKPGS